MKTFADLGSRILSLFRVDETAPESVLPKATLPDIPNVELRKDWLALLRGLVDAIAPFAGEVDEESDRAMIRRMGGDALRAGIEALEWLEGEPKARKVLRSLVSKKSRASAIAKLSMTELTPRLSPTFERAASVHLAGAVSDVVVSEDGRRARIEKDAEIPLEVRQRALLVCFSAYARELYDLRQQFQLARAANPALPAAGDAISKAFRVANIVEIRPAAEAPLDLATARAVGFQDGSENDRVVSVRKVGMSYRTIVLRKAEVVVSRQQRAKQEESNGS